MKWIEDYRAGPIEAALISVWCRCVLFGSAILLGLSLVAAVDCRGLPSWGQIVGPLPLSLLPLVWFFFPRCLLVHAATILLFAKNLQTDSIGESLLCLVTAGALWAWIASTVF